MKQQRWLILVVPLLLWLFSQAFLWQPALFYSALALGALLIIIAVRAITRPTPHDWLLFIISPVLFFLSFSGLAAVLISHFWIQFIFILEFWFVFSYLKQVYYYFYYPAPPWREKLDNLLMAGGFLTVYAAAAVLFGLPAFLSLSPLVMLPSLALIIGLLFLQFSLFPRDNWRGSGRLALTLVLILAELAWVLSLWSLNFNLLALFLSLAYYLGLTIIRLAGRGNLNRRTLRLPLLLSALIILILFLTARWL
jgi:hypothetical protein